MSGAVSKLVPVVGIAAGMSVGVAANRALAGRFEGDSTRTVAIYGANLGIAGLGVAALRSGSLPGAVKYGAAGAVSVAALAVVAHHLHGKQPQTVPAVAANPPAARTAATPEAAAGPARVDVAEPETVAEPATTTTVYELPWQYQIDGHGPRPEVSGKSPSARDVVAFNFWAAHRYGLDPHVLLNIAALESTFHTTVVNTTDSNARKGTPSKGMYQFIEETFWRGTQNAIKADPEAFQGIVSAETIADPDTPQAVEELKSHWLDWRLQAITCAFAVSKGGMGAWTTYPRARALEDRFQWIDKMDAAIEHGHVGDADDWAPPF